VVFVLQEKLTPEVPTGKAHRGAVDIRIPGQAEVVSGAWQEQFSKVVVGIFAEEPIRAKERRDGCPVNGNKDQVQGKMQGWTGRLQTPRKET